MKGAVVQARVPEELKKEATDILSTLGMSASEAINIFLNQVVLNHGLPFDVKIPNEMTIQAMKEAEEADLKAYDSVDDLFTELNK